MRDVFTPSHPFPKGARRSGTQFPVFGRIGQAGLAGRGVSFMGREGGGVSSLLITDGVC